MLNGARDKRQETRDVPLSDKDLYVSFQKGDSWANTTL